MPVSCRQFMYCVRSGIVSSQAFVMPATRCATGQCGHRTFGMDAGWFYNDGGRLADILFIFEDSGRQCKLVENSGRPWKIFANGLVTVEEVA